MLDFTTLPTPVIKSFYQLRKGDVVETTTGKLYAFDRIPKGAKNWYGKSIRDGKSYRIRLMMGANFNVVGSYNFPRKIVAPIIPSQNDANNLTTGDLFVIKHGRGDNAELFRYVRSTGKKIIGVNPLTNKTYNIDKSFTFTKVGNLPY